MNGSEPTPIRTEHVSWGEQGHQGFLLAAARTLVRDVGAAAATIFLRASDVPELRAAVVAVTPLGIGSVERVSLDDELYPSARAWRTNSVVTMHGPDLMALHPDLSVLAPFPLQVAAAPISSPSRQFGTITVYWARSRDTTVQADIDYLVEVAAGLAVTLEQLADQHELPQPPVVPLVVGAQSVGAIEDFSTSTSPLIYHVHKLAMLLTRAESTSEVIAIAIARVMGGFSAQAATVSLLHENRLRLTGASGCSAEFVRTADGIPLGRDTPETNAVVRQEHTQYAPHDPRTRGRVADGTVDPDCTWLVLPLLFGRQSVGALSLAFDRQHQAIATQKSTLTALATVLTQAVERTQMHEAQHSLMEELQQAMLPRMLPQPAGIVTTGRYASATSGIEMGGDWYDVLTLPTGNVAMIIGDVEGHNPSAAALMGQLSSAVRAYANEGHGPGEVLERANHLLVDLNADLFATCCCMWLDPDTGVAQIASAGHPPPLVSTADGIQPPPDDLDIGIPLGIDYRTRYAATELTLMPETVMAYFTDGLINLGGELDPAAMTANVAGDVDIESLGDRIMGDLESEHAAHPDDAALLLVRYEGPSNEARRTVRQLKIHRRDLQGAQRTRRLLREWLEAWNLSDMADEEELLITEVVTNGLVHGDSDVHVVVRRYPDRVRVEVRDSDPHRARTVTVPRQEDEAEGGRGLMIVSALASAWGNSPSGRGKTVWFEVPVPA